MLNKVRDWLGLTALEGPAGHGHDHGADGSHGHTHGVIDPTIATTERGLWAVKWSFIFLAITAALQFVAVLATGSVALLADMIHNVADATTAIPLWIAFKLAQRKPTATFTYGYGRVEDLAGIAIVLIILFSALVAGYESIARIFHPQPITMLKWVALAGLIGFIGNEIVAVFRIRVGREINSAALIADGYHARTDGLTSLAVVAGAFGVWLGFPLADPIIGLLITVAIFGIVWQSAKAVLTRMLDGVDPAMVSEIRHSAEHVSGIKMVLDVKARWLGHKLHSDVAILVDGKLSVADADQLGARLKQEMLAHIPSLSVVNVRCQGSELVETETHSSPQKGGHHHAPGLFMVASALATGILEIADTPNGERMRLSLERPMEGLQAIVIIDRSGGRVETLRLAPVAGNDGVFESAVAPDEPHEFSARLSLKSGSHQDVLPFKMAEPIGHHH
ncbi:MAG: cation diffusion facilitator family transporter [Hyphomicrobium sp.]